MLSFVKKLIIFCVFLSSSTYAYNSEFFHVSKTENLTEEVLFNKTQKDTLIIFDLDYVLLAPKDKILRPCGEKNHLRKNLFKFLFEQTKGKNRIINNSQLPEFDYLISIIVNSAATELVDSHFVGLIKQLQEHQIPMLVLSSNVSGQTGMIDNLTIQRHEELKKFDIHFTDSIFTSTKSLYSVEGHSPQFYKGLLFTDKATKGNVLKTFLMEQQYLPRLIVFIDDREEMLSSVAKACKELNIPFKGIHYTKLADQEEECNSEVAHLQFNYLLNNEVWLNDAEALQHLKNNQ